MVRKTFCVLALVGGLALPRTHGAEINVFAAASLTDALTDIGTNFEKQSGDKIVFNFAASSLLARQVSEHAPADIFFSADEAKMDDLEKAGLIAGETRKDLLSNVLVIVVTADSALTMSAPEELIQKAKKIAIAEPRTVPAGIYTREYLTRLGLWTKIEEKIIPTENVRAALAAVESGNVDAGFVYKTDANTSKKVKIAFSVPVEDGPLIRYPIALLSQAKNKEGAEKFRQYLESDEARRVFERFGFIVKF